MVNQHVITRAELATLKVVITDHQAAFAKVRLAFPGCTCRPAALDALALSRTHSPSHCLRALIAHRAS